MNEMIEELKNNEKPFGLLTKDESKFLIDNYESCEYFGSSGWKPKSGETFGNQIAYRLIDIFTLTPEPEIVRCEVSYNSKSNRAYFTVGENDFSLLTAAENRDWTGEVEWANGEKNGELYRIVDGKNTHPESVLMRRTNE